MKKLIIAGAIVVIGAVVLFFTMGGTIDTGTNVEDSVILDAITKTYENETYEYDYEFKGRIMYKLAAEWGPWADAETTGNVKLNPNPTLDTNFMYYKESSGSLLFDTKEYSYNIGNQIIIEQLDDDNKLTHKTSQTDTGVELDLDLNYLNVMLSELTEADIDYVKYFESNDEYHVGLSNTKNDAIIQRIARIARAEFSNNRGYLDIDKDFELTITDGKITSMNYSISAETTDMELSFEFGQSFLKYSDVEIVIPEHAGVLVGTDLTAELDVIEGLFDSTFTGDYVNFDFNFNSQVDAGSFSASLGTDFRGSHITKKTGETTYFSNYYELDSDYKPELEDQKQSLAMLNNAGKEVWKEIYKFASNDYEQITTYDANKETSFMSLNIDDLKDNVDFMYVTEENETKTYTIGVTNDYVSTIFALLNSSVDYEVYKVKSDLLIGLMTYEIEVVSGSIENINIVVEGNFTDTSDVSQDFELSLDYDIKTDDVTEYTVATEKEDVN